MPQLNKHESMIRNNMNERMNDFFKILVNKVCHAPFHCSKSLPQTFCTPHALPRRTYRRDSHQYNTKLYKNQFQTKIVIQDVKV